jgi:hypothetical protein
MNRPNLILLGLLGALVPARAQSTPALFSIYPDVENPQNCTEFVSRSDLGSGGGEILMGGLGEHVWGFGDYTSAAFPRPEGYISSFRARLQDQTIATRDQFRFVLRRADGSGQQPDASAAGLVYRSQWFPMPGNSSTFDFTFALGAPITYDTRVRHYFGVELAAAPTYPADGLAVWYADDRLGTRGDNPRAGAPGHTWVVKNGAAFLTREQGSFFFGLHTRAPVVVAGARNAANTRQVPTGALNFGRGGLYPDVAGAANSGRRDSLAVQLRAPGTGGGGAVAVFALSTGLGPTAFALPGISGKLYLSPNGLFLLSPVVVPALGVVTLEFPMNPYLGAFLASNDLFVQALLVLASQAQFGNAARWQTSLP